MQVFARFRLDDGRRAELSPESVIGRMTHAALRVDDPRISEAHALISLRGAELRLLALRGRVSVDGKPKTEVVLEPGVRVVLASFFGLTVEQVQLPEHIHAVLPEDTPGAALAAAGVVAIFPHADPPLRLGFDPEAGAHVWTRKDDITLRVADPSDPEGRSGDRSLAVGERFTVCGRAFRLVELARSLLETHPTADKGRFDTRLDLVLHFDSAHVHSSDGRSVVLDGLAARAISELHAIGTPVAWQELVRLLWPTEPAADTIRQRWDQLMTRIRMKLREAGLRSDLVRATRQGLVELVLGPSDTVTDKS